MSRNLTRSHEHFQRALKRLPLGVASNFRYWGEDRTIYVKSGRGARKSRCITGISASRRTLRANSVRLPHPL